MANFQSSAPLQPRVVVQFVNGEDVPPNVDYSSGDELVSVDHLAVADFDETAINEDMGLSSPAASSSQEILTNRPIVKRNIDVTHHQHLPSVLEHERPSRESSMCIHPPASPSPPPSMTPPPPPDLFACRNNNVQNVKSVNRSSSSSGVVVDALGQHRLSSDMNNDHCYGLPYEDHNYGGADRGSVDLSNVLPSTGLHQTASRMGNIGTSLPDSHDSQEPFPIIGGLASYLGEDDTECINASSSPNMSSAPLLCAGGRPISVTRSMDTFSANSYRGGKRDVSILPFYQRYASTQSIDPNTSPSYSQSLVTIGGRTYIRQVSTPAVNMVNSAYRGIGRDYFGLPSSALNRNNSAMMIPRIGIPATVTSFKRAGRPRTRGGIQPHQSQLRMTSTMSPATLGRSSNIRGRGTIRAHGESSTVGSTFADVGSLNANLRIVSMQNDQGNNNIVDDTNTSVTKTTKTPSKQVVMSEVAKKYQQLLDSPFPSLKSTRRRRITIPNTTTTTAAAAAPVNNDLSSFHERTPSPITSVIMASRMDRTRSQIDLASSATTNEFSSTRHAAAANKLSVGGSKREKTPDFSQFNDPCASNVVKSEKINNEEKNEAEHLLRDRSESELRSPTDGDQFNEMAPNTHRSDSGIDDKRWTDSDYVTRCICGFEHNDEFMISCDRCEVWQHCRCMGVDGRRIPEKYLCELCNPRPLKNTGERARQIQETKLAKWNRDKERRRRNVRENRKRKSSDDSDQPKNAVSVKHGYQLIDTNEYTESIQRLIDSIDDTDDKHLSMKQYKSCQVMFVAPATQGIVATDAISPNEEVAEYCGRVCDRNEIAARDSIGPHCLIYRLPSSVASDDTVICIDARLKGSLARFARRSCRPNTQIKHIIDNHKLYIVLVAVDHIERGTEVTRPFDYDFRLSKFPPECACINQAKKGSDDSSEQCLINMEVGQKKKGSSSAIKKELQPDAIEHRTKHNARSKPIINRRGRTANMKVKKYINKRKNIVPMRLARRAGRLKLKTKRQIAGDRVTVLSKVKPKSESTINVAGVSAVAPTRNVVESALSNTKLLNREERKLQMAVAQIARLEENVKKKEDRIRKRVLHPQKKMATLGSRRKPLKQESSTQIQSLSAANTKRRQAIKKSKIKTRVSSRRFASKKIKADDEMVTCSQTRSRTISSSDERLSHTPLQLWMANKTDEPIIDKPHDEVESSGARTEQLNIKATVLPSISVAGGKKRWLRQAMMSESTDSADEISPSTNFATSLNDERIKIETHERHNDDDTATVSSANSDRPAKRERRKMTFDEYKRRKEAGIGTGEGSVETPSTSQSTECAPKEIRSFIPQMDKLDILETGRSHRLTSLPDPNRIGKTDVTIDDLKRRIYGRNYIDEHRGMTPPPPPPLSKRNEEQRMSLADRLRKEFGLEDAAGSSRVLPCTVSSGSGESLPFPPPPPPPPASPYRTKTLPINAGDKAETVQKE